MASREGDTALWLHNKLGSTDDLWSGNSICSQLTRDKLVNIQDCFHNLQSYVKVKLLLSFLHLPKRNMDEWKSELEEIINMAQDDTDQWVAIIGNIMKSYPASGSLNTELDDHHMFFHEVLGDLRKLVRKSHDVGMTPLECLYLGRSALTSVAGQTPQPNKHFSMKRKPKSAALRAELLQKSSEAASKLKKTGTSVSVPVKFRSFAKKMDDKTPMRGIPNRPTGPGGFIKSAPLGRSFGGNTAHRSMANNREGGIKLLDISEQPVGAREAKRRRKMQELEHMEQTKKEKESQSLTPDYAANLMAPGTVTANVIVSAVSATGPSYVPTTRTIPTTTPQTLEQGTATQQQQARENLTQHLRQQLGQAGAHPPNRPPPHIVSVTPINTHNTQLTQPQDVFLQQQQQQLQQQQQAVAAAGPLPQAAPPPAGAVPSLQTPQRTLLVAGGVVGAAPGGGAVIQPANAQKRGLSLTREQMMEAQEMFKSSNKVTRPEKALILGFMAGSRENPCPNQGDIVNIRLSENMDSVEQPDGLFKPMMVDTYFQMNYSTGEWKRIKKFREMEVE